MERLIVYAVLVSTIGLSQANILSVASMLGAPVKRSMVDSERQARAEDAKNKIDQLVAQLAAAVSEAQRQESQKKRDLPTIMDTWLTNDALNWGLNNKKRDMEKKEVPSLFDGLFDASALEEALQTNKRNAEKSFTDTLDSVVNQVNAALDAGEKKRREEPNFENSWFSDDALSWGLDKKKRDTEKRGVPSVVDALFDPAAFAEAFQSRKRDTESFNDKLNTIVNQVNAAIDAGDKKRREEPRFGQALFNGFPFAMGNLQRKRDAQDDVQQEVDSVVNEINEALGADDDDSELSRRGLFSCVGYQQSCVPLIKRCCGENKCRKAKWYHIKGTCRGPNEPY